MATKYFIAEQILFRLAGGDPLVTTPVEREDLYAAINDKVNAMLKGEYFAMTLAQGESLPENLLLATYDNIAVTSNNGRSKATLPATPISLQRNMGIFQIYNPDYPDALFIPLMAGQRALLQSQKLLSGLFGQISYEPYGMQIIFDRDLTLLGMDTVSMRLVVFEISQYSVTERLPIPSDYVEKIINELVESFGSVPSKSGIVDNYTDKMPNTQ